MNLPSGSSDYPLLDDKWTYVPDLDQVEFDGDEWEQEEVTYLVLDTVSKLKPTDLTEAKELQISSLHSDKPYVRIGTHVFEGQYENLIGSEMLLSEMEGPDGQTSHFPFALTKSHLHLQSVNLVPKQRQTEHSSQFLASLPHPGPKLPASMLKVKGATGRGRGRPRKDPGEVRLPWKGPGRPRKDDARVQLPTEVEEFDFGEDLQLDASTSQVPIEEDEAEGGGEARIDLDNLQDSNVQEDARVVLPGFDMDTS